MPGKEGIIKEDSTREREILTYASYYHDIGRIGNNGPHAKRSAKKIEKLDLNYLDGKPFSDVDKRLVEFLAEGHEGKDDSVDKLIQKYNIPEQDVEMAKNLLWTIKDADALDRARLATNLKVSTVTDLNPKFLRLDSSKRLMEASYGLEYLTSVTNIGEILNYKNEKVNEKYNAPKRVENKLDYIVVKDFDKKLEEQRSAQTDDKEIESKTNEEEQR